MGGKHALVIEDAHGISAKLQDLNFSVERHCHRTVNTGFTNTIAHRIKQGNFAFVWSEFPLAGQHIQPSKVFAHFSQLCCWARLCSDTGTPFVLFGSFGKKWDDAQVRALITDVRLTVAHHRLCHFGLRVDSSQAEPSSTCFISASTFPIASHRCQCSVPKESHKLDWNAQPTSSQDKLRLRAQIAIAGKALEEITSNSERALRSTPDSTVPSNLHSTVSRNILPTAQDDASKQPYHSTPDVAAQPAYPTESRERQKVMQKARKLAGGAAKKKKFIIEDHYDDCGTDLSGLGADICFLAADVLIVDDFNINPATNHCSDTLAKFQNLPEYENMFPAVGTDTADSAAAPPAAEEAWRKCDGCRWRRSKTDPSHNREPGICKYPLDAPVEWDCPGCRKHANAGDSSHTYEPGSCKFTQVESRLVGQRRQGRHPREPSKPAARHPTADLQAQLPDGAFLGAADEAALQPPAQAASTAEAEEAPDVTVSGPASSSRGPDLQPRTIRVFKDTAAGSPTPSDWTRFDIGSSLRVLRNGGQAGIQR